MKLATQSWSIRSFSRSAQRPMRAALPQVAMACEPVETSASRRTRSGAMRKISSAIRPPIECPKTSNRSAPAASAAASAMRAISPSESASP